MNRISRFIKRIPCFFGKHNMVIGFGWSTRRRYDCCINCKYHQWVDDPEGLKKYINE